MAEQFRQHLKKIISVPDEDLPGILSFFQAQSAKKKENLLVEGALCKYHYFVVQGCLRIFFVNDKGVEQTTQFAIENWWLTDYQAFHTQQITTYYIQAVEKTEVLAISFSALEQLLRQFPAMERYFRLVYQRAYAASQARIRYLYDLSREEMYHHFATHYPAFVQRVPQYLLASFLGFTPEYLSEIRKKSVLKPV